MRFYFTRYLLRRWPFLTRIFWGYASWALFDIPVILGGFALALLLRSFTANVDVVTGLLFALLVVGAFITANILFGVYNQYWSYAAAHGAVTILGASLVGMTATLAVTLLFNPRPLPLSVVLAGSFFAMSGQLVIRYRRRVFSGARWALRNSLRRVLSEGSRTLIVGAGEAGQALAFHIQMNPAGRAYDVVGFLDDDAGKVGKTIHGIPVLAHCDEVIEVARQNRIELIIIAIHNVHPARLRALIDLCMETPARIRLLPDSLSSLSATTDPPLLREPTIEDIIERSALPIDLAPIQTLVEDRVILVTGACGSIGSELARQLLEMHPRRLLLLDNNESGIHELHFSLCHQSREAEAALAPVVGDVTLAAQIERLFAAERPDLVFHTAAYKHVSWMESHPLQAIRVNVLGTRIVRDACWKHGTQRLVLVSSDKAVEPTNVMGATKRLAEVLVLDGGAPGHVNGREGNRVRIAPAVAMQGVSANNASPQVGPYVVPQGGPDIDARCIGTAVRFGNVLGSRGSVIPTFERQIAAGGPVTVTDERMRRYFMSVSEAVSLVLAAAALSRGGDLFILDMGHDIAIRDLAHRMIRFRGLRPEIDIPIVYTGIRPGEKLAEQLLGPEETTLATQQPGILRVQARNGVEPGTAEALVQQLTQCVAEYDEQSAVEILWSAVRQVSGAQVAAPAD